MLRNTRCLVVGLDEDGRVAELNCPWGDCEVDALRVGEPLPESLVAVLAAVPPERAEQHFPFIYLDETTVVDVYVLGPAAERKLILRDVSEAHQAELKFQQKAYEVSLLSEKQAELNRRLEDQRAELERANQAKSRFIASMSHEFRTPITSIMGYADRMSRGPVANGSPAAIQRASWHLLTLVENLLEQARQGEGAVHLNSGPIDLERLLQDLGELFSHQAQGKGLELVVAPAPPGAALENDELRLRQALINLLGNAIRYTRDGRIALDLRITGERLEFAVSDTGPGIDEADRERIFKPFERLDPGEQTGAGLGLSITRQVVAAMGGELELESSPGQGSTFRFSLALAAPESVENPNRLGGLRALLVEDDPDVLAIHELYLADFGLAVDSASSLAEGLERIGQREYDIVLADLFLDSDSGADLLQAVRAAQPACKTLLCSGAGTYADWQLHFGDCADDFLLKPVQPENLKAALDRILSHNP
ncbi:MAG: response regulator [Xanthomonadales bacterium]|nr:response regulator [Xanthomonadales bacterium]